MAVARTVRRLEFLLLIITVFDSMEIVRSEFAVESCHLSAIKEPYNIANPPAIIYIDSAQLTSYAAMQDVTKNLSILRASHQSSNNELDGTGGLRVEVFCLNVTIVDELAKIFFSNHLHLLRKGAMVPGRCVIKNNLFFDIQYQQYPRKLYLWTKVHQENGTVSDVVLVLYNWHELSVTEVDVNYDPVHLNVPEELKHSNCSFRISFSYLFKKLKSDSTTNLMSKYLPLFVFVVLFKSMV